MSACVFCGGDHHREVKCPNPSIRERYEKLLREIKMQCALGYSPTQDGHAWANQCFDKITKICDKGL